jgi:hypothetical protein
MRATELFLDTPITAPGEDFDVAGLTHDSRRVRPGDLFVALEGDCLSLSRAIPSTAASSPLKREKEELSASSAGARGRGAWTAPGFQSTTRDAGSGLWRQESTGTLTES